MGYPMRVTFLVVVASLVSGCAMIPDIPRWKEGATKEEYQRDRLRCEYEAARATPYASTLYEGLRQMELEALCMKARGYTNEPPVMRWSKAGATQDEFMRDRDSCIQEARQRVSKLYAQQPGSASDKIVIDRGSFFGCMGARGYQSSPNGTFAPPTGTEVLVVN